MAQYTRAGLLKRIVLIFWSAWITIVALMNVGNLLQVIGALPEGWKLSSRNYEAIVHVTSVYGTPHWLDWLFLLGVTSWEALCACLSWLALRRYHVGHARRWRSVYLAQTALFALFASFILLDEVFHAYKMEGDHRGIATLLLAGLVVMRLLPETDDR